jgi:hypothetical protein
LVSLFSSVSLRNLRTFPARLDKDRRLLSKGPQAETLDAMKDRARKFVETSGVSLKYDNDELDDFIDRPGTSLDHKDPNAIAQLLLAKHRGVNPNDTTLKNTRELLKGTIGLLSHDIEDNLIPEIVFKWKELHDEEVKKVTFDNLSSYEP